MAKKKKGSAKKGAETGQPTAIMEENSVSPGPPQEDRNVNVDLESLRDNSNMQDSIPEFAQFGNPSSLDLINGISGKAHNIETLKNIEEIRSASKDEAASLKDLFVEEQLQDDAFMRLTEGSGDIPVYSGVIKNEEYIEEYSLEGAVDEITGDVLERIKEISVYSQDDSRTPSLGDHERVSQIPAPKESIRDKLSEDIKKISTKTLDIDAVLEGTDEDSFINSLSESEESVDIAAIEQEENVESDESFETEEFSAEIENIREQLESMLGRLEGLEAIKDKLKIPEKSGSIDKKRTAKARLRITKNDPEMDIPEIEIDEGISVQCREALKAELEDILEKGNDSPLKKELTEFKKIIDSAAILEAIRLKVVDVIGRESIDYQELVGLYRVISKILITDISSKNIELESVKSEFDKFKKRSTRLGNILGSSQIKPGMGMSKDSDVVDINKESEIEKRIKESEMEKEMFLLRETVKKRENETKLLNVQLDRMRTDFNNYRSRQGKEQDRLTSKAQEAIFLDLLNVIDNFDRAVAFISDIADPESTIEGFRKIYEDFMKILAKYDLKEIVAKGEMFDPNYHEALVREETMLYPEGMVIDIIRKGYIYGNKVLRPTQVVTANQPSGNPQIPEAAQGQLNNLSLDSLNESKDIYQIGNMKTLEEIAQLEDREISGSGMLNSDI